MAGFRKAKAEQAALKMGIYGPPGSGKTFTALLIAEGLGRVTKKRVAYVDTEHGTDFYCQPVNAREVHPQAFDFDAIYTRSMTEVLSTVREIDQETYGVVVIDSMTHLWEACIQSYGGKQTSAGTIPMHAWGKIKKPYKDLMSFLLSSNLHVILCGRQGTEYSTDEETQELKAVGVKMKAEGETPYEPHILIRMEAVKPKKTNEVATIVAYAEKDRTGVLAGRSGEARAAGGVELISLVFRTRVAIEAIHQRRLRRTLPRKRRHDLQPLLRIRLRSLRRAADRGPRVAADCAAAGRRHADSGHQPALL